MPKPTLSEQIDGLTAAKLAHDIVLRALALAMFDSDTEMRIKRDAALEGLSAIQKRTGKDKSVERVLKLARTRVSRLLEPIGSIEAGSSRH